MRQRYCRKCGEWHALEAWPPDCFARAHVSCSNLSSPNFISDTLDPVQSQLDGRIYDSKSRLRETYRNAGVVEVGNDSSVMNPVAKRPPRVPRDDIKASVAKAFSRAGFGS